MSQNQYTPVRPQEEEINLREEIGKYLHYWPWFVIGVVITLSIAFLYLKYTIPSYNTSASIIIKDEESKGPSSDMSAFVDLGLLSGMGTNSIENEIGLLKSRRLMTEVVKALDLNVRYIDNSQIPAREIYRSSPYLVQILRVDENMLGSLEGEEVSKFSLIGSENKITLKNLETGKTYVGKPGEPVNLGFTDVVITQNKGAKYTTIELIIDFKLIDAIASAYKEKVQVNLTDKNSSLIELSLIDHNREKARDILDQLILEYNKEAIQDKNLVARNTAEFIEERLAIINEELDSVETGKEQFKEQNSLTDIQAESSLFIENASEFNKKEQEIGTQLELANAMIQYLSNGSTGDLMPANLGIKEEGVNQRIQEYNDLVLERNRILSGSTEKNPVVIRLNNQIDQIKNNVFQSLQRMRDNLKIAQQELDRQSARIGSKIAAVPGKERQYRGIERQQNIKESLYLFLLQKREENSLNMAVTAPKAKIVDGAYSSNTPVSPKSKIVLLAGLIIGLLVPFMVIYIKNLLNNKVRSRGDINDLASAIPVIGEIPRLAKGQPELIQQNDRSVLAESFRLLHANMQYFLSETDNSETGKGTCMFITSTIKGEGKTFISFNLAKTLAATGKKVLLMGADLRNPQLQRFEKDAKSWLGVSNYLVDRSVEVRDLIRNSTLHENLDILTSGSIPPNPAELLRSSRMDDLFQELRLMYDYIIVDTAPSMVVADTFLINRFADLTLYTVRADYTQRQLLAFASDAKKDDKLKNVGIVLNSVKATNYGYGRYGYSYGYGYAYGEDEVSLWKRIKSSLNLF